MNAKETADDIPLEWWEALQANKLELHGNYLWRSGSSLFAPQSKNEQEKLDALRLAIRVLNDSDISPFDKAQQLKDIKGFGENTATGLVMVFHPESFAIRNTQSRSALAKLHIHEDSLESFQYAVTELRQAVGAENFLSLDWFLYQVAQENVDIKSGEPAEAWLFQANPKFFNLAEELLNIENRSEDDWSVSRYRDEMQIGDSIVLWQGGPAAGIYAVGELIGMPFKRPTGDFWPDKEQREPTEWAVPFRYTQILKEPISKSVLREHPVLNDLQVIRAPQGTNFRVTTDQWNALEDLLDPKQKVAVRRVGFGGASVEQPIGPTITELAAETFLDESHLRDIESLLTSRKQLIFEGPPGSGKTFVAEKFARYFTSQALTGDRNDRVELVQFHQSYSYEDFVEGIRPETIDNQLHYNVKPGIFRNLANRAAGNPDQNYVLIIDEINRGNVSRILGELMLLLEYRDESATLPYSQEPLQIPDNLFIIGTMNSADRSLSQIDYALRRRFYFVRFLSVEQGEAKVLSRWLDTQQLESDLRDRILHRFIELNAKLKADLDTDDLQVGHSYLMQPNIGDDNVRKQVWKYAVIPLIREYLYHHRDRDELLQSYELQRLASIVQPIAEETGEPAAHLINEAPGEVPE